MGYSRFDLHVQLLAVSANLRARDTAQLNEVVTRLVKLFVSGERSYF